jgi:uncharacterized membrane protein YciS (DUF1049 family)
MNINKVLSFVLIAILLPATAYVLATQPQLLVFPLTIAETSYKVNLGLPLLLGLVLFIGLILFTIWQ